MTPKTFSIYIEKEVQSKDISHMDAVLEYCSKNNLEPDSVISLLQKPLKAVSYTHLTLPTKRIV